MKEREKRTEEKSKNEGRERERKRRKWDGKEGLRGQFPHAHFVKIVEVAQLGKNVKHT